MKKEIFSLLSVLLLYLYGMFHGVISYELGGGYGFVNSFLFVGIFVLIVLIISEVKGGFLRK